MKKTIIVVAAASFLAGCFVGSSGFHDLKNASFAEFQKSDAAKWIALPSNAVDIATFNFFGFDTNHRFLKATLASDPPALTGLLDQSVQIQPRTTNDTFISSATADVTFEKFTSVFLGPSTARPTWWETDFSRFDQQSFCAWQSTNNYGYGYLYLYDSQQKELRAFQWSQQWNTAEDTKRALTE
jgi:hypothetical protein